MTDEEKKAINIVKGITEDDLLNYWEGPEEPYNAIQTVLNLIEKQSKEIEELKTITNQYDSFPMYNKKQSIIIASPDYFHNGTFIKKYISKDKIKAKIEELENEYTGCTTNVFSVLQSLLEKE